MPHPSLTAPFVSPEPLKPQSSMAPYELCWCRSGKKFKFCHYHRERQKPISVFEYEQKMLADLRDGYCSHPEASKNTCSPKITNAHTVQRRGGLGAIAEDGHVLTVKPSLQAMIEHKGLPPPRRIGIGRASVFPGFCNAHDSSTFGPIEGNEIALDQSAAFLFAYRTIAYERFTKAAALRLAEIQRELDRGKSFQEQALIQHMIYVYSKGLEIGMKDIEDWKASYDRILLSSNQSDFRWLAFRFDRLLPLAGCGAFHPENDFNGNRLQQLGRRPFDFEHLSLTITSFAQRSVAFFGWLGKNAGPGEQLAASFCALPDDRKADALVRLAFEHLENIYLTPSWWEALSDDSRIALQHAVHHGTPFTERKLDSLVDHGSIYAIANVIETSN